MIRFRPPRIAVALACAAAAADAALPVPLRVVDAHPVAGALLAAAALGMMLRGWWVFRAAGVALGPTAPTARLITTDVYRFTRNPMYLGLVMTMAAGAVAMGTAPFFVAAVAYAVILDRVFCRYEERKLTATFGDEYLAYKRYVRRWA